MDIIAKLNRLRLERNMSVYRLAELSGLNQSTLANTFSRRTIPSIRNLEIICNTLGITLSQFFCEDEKEVSMTAADREFFGNYKKLSPQMQEAVKNIVDTMSCEQKS